ncbi:MAG: hypothetical protein Q9170_004201 [Blastenia crenularia]
MTAEQPCRWDPVGCKQYIVDVIGNQERFPEGVPYSSGTITVLERLINRYGEEYCSSSARVFRNFLEDLNEGTSEEQALWHGWRLTQADKVVGLNTHSRTARNKHIFPQSSKWSLVLRAEEAIQSWDDGDLPIKQYSPIQPHSPSSSHYSSSPSTGDINQPTQSLPSASSKRHLRSLTQRLLIQATPEDSPYMQHDFDSVDPVKFSPPEDIKAKATMSAFESFDEFDEDNQRVTRIDDLLREYQKANAQPSPTAPRFKPVRYQHKGKGMSHSMSENNMSFRQNHGHNQFPSASHQQPDQYEFANTTSDDGPDTTSHGPARGRLPVRTTSPTKMLEDISEVQTPVGISDHSADTILPTHPPASPIKRSRSPMKRLFGDNGFLGRSTSMKELPSDEYRRKGVKNLGEKLKQRVGGMTEGVSRLLPASISHGELSRLIPTSLSNRESPSRSGATTGASTFAISLNPPEQAKFYSEAELMICATANNYLTIQKEEGRMSYESVAKVMSFWTQKNRPQVVDFMFDQLTQRDLVLQNLKTFRFYGPNAENLMSMNAMMHSWKTLAKEMSVRTFCTGDSTIRKQIQDIYKILELLGAPMVTFMAFQQIQVRVLKIMREQQKVRDEQEATKFGVERKWEPPGGFGLRDSAESEAYANPFTDSRKV